MEPGPIHHAKLNSKCEHCGRNIWFMSVTMEFPNKENPFETHLELFGIITCKTCDAPDYDTPFDDEWSWRNVA